MVSLTFISLKPLEDLTKVNKDSKLIDDETSSEIKDFTERDDLNPTLEILLGIVTGGLYFKYWYYKYGKIVYKELPLKAGMNNTEDKTMVLVVIDIIIALMWWGGMILRVLLLAIASYNSSVINKEFSFDITGFTNKETLIIKSSIAASKAG